MLNTRVVDAARVFSFDLKNSLILKNIPIPENQRARLIEGLNLLIEYQSARDWERVYDLLTDSIRGGRSRQDFANSRRELENITPASTILAFAPTEAIPVDEWQDGGAWQILGCAKYRRKGGIRQLKSAVEAVLRQGEWRFTEIGVATQVDGPEEPCSTPKQRARRNVRTAARSSLRCLGANNKKTKGGRQRTPRLCAHISNLPE